MFLSLKKTKNMKKFVLLFIFVFLTVLHVQAQEQSKFRPTHVGIYHSGITGQVAIGTDFNNRYFGDIRFGAADLLETRFGIEGSVNWNLFQDDWFNFSVGIMAGYYFYDDIRLGLPLAFTIKPFENHRRLAFLLEATPNIFADSGYTSLRGNIGIRYLFRK